MQKKAVEIVLVFLFVFIRVEIDLLIEVLDARLMVRAEVALAEGIGCDVDLLDRTFILVYALALCELFGHCG